MTLSIPVIPDRGYRYLSLRLAMVNHEVDLKQVTESLGFGCEQVELRYPNKQHPEIQVLLWQGRIEDTPEDMDDRIDRLADWVGDQAIRYTTGGWTQQCPNSI